MRLMLVCVLWLAALPAFAATYYVRPSGGTATQCNGTANVDYSAGVAPACAWKSLSYALGVNGGSAARINGGDTVIVKNGSYPIGYHSSFDITNCTSSSRASCYLRAAPSGPSASERTRILGEESETGCKKRPELWGTEAVNRVINVQSSSNVEYACLEITDHSACVIKHYDSAKLCASTGSWGYDGVRGQAATNYLWRDVNIHGMSRLGVYASGLTDWTMERLRLYANGYGGWNGQITQDSADYNFGTLHFKQAEIGFNGCTENYPSLAIHACIGEMGDDTDGDGPIVKTPGSENYGDGIGTYHTGGAWIFEDSLIHHNTQDGVDMLYLTRPGGSITIRRTRSWGNAGNQVKLSGTSLIENSVIIGSCHYYAVPTVRYYPAMNVYDACRASGNAVSLRPYPEAGVKATIRFSTITGSGDNLINISTGGNGAGPDTIVRVENSVLYGQTEYGTTTKTHIAYVQGGSTLPTLQWYNNHIRDVIAGSTWNGSSGTTISTCPTGSYCAAAPGLRDLGALTFDPRPIAGSNVIGTGTTCGGGCVIPSTDLNGRTRPAAPARGALEYAP